MYTDVDTICTKKCKENFHQKADWKSQVKQYIQHVLYPSQKIWKKYYYSVSDW